MINRVFIDASVLVKLFDDNAPVEQAAARNLIGDVDNATLVTSALAIADFYEEVTYFNCYALQLRHCAGTTA